jgi:putative ABC transport system substrate-binding protein
VNRRAFLTALGGSLLAAPLAAEAQHASRVRIGWLAVARVPSDVATFRERLRALGWVEGENVSTEERYSEGKSERAPSLAADLVRAKVDVIVAIGTGATAAAQQATASIPVVFVVGTDPVERGFVASFGRPGGNLTGIATLGNEMLNVKMLEVLRNAVPGITRVGVFHQPNLIQRQAMTVVSAGARALSVQLVPIEVRSAGDIDRASATLAQERVHALLVLSNPFFHAEKDRFVKLAATMRLPAIYEYRGFVESGGLMSYGSDLREVFGRLAIMVDKVLKGTKPGDLPVEQPTRIELVINAKTAKALGLTIPPSLLQRADQVIE